MPYFTRRPYAEMQVASPSAPPVPSPDILALAGEVLAYETGGATEGTFRMRSPVAPGTTGRIVLNVSADPGPVIPALRLAPSDLVGAAGRIAASQIRVDPQTMLAAPSQEMVISVAVPPGTAAGLYSGTVTAPGPDGFVLRIEVPVSG